MSERKFSSRICGASMGRNDRNIEAPAMLNMLPKLPLMAVRMYLSVLANVTRPSSMPCFKIARSFLSSTKSAASLATSTAVSTEMPTSAACKAGASLMPSPI